MIVENLTAKNLYRCAPSDCSIYQESLRDQPEASLMHTCVYRQCVFMLEVIHIHQYVGQRTTSSAVNQMLSSFLRGASFIGLELAGQTRLNRQHSPRTHLPGARIPSVHHTWLLLCRFWASKQVLWLIQQIPSQPSSQSRPLVSFCLVLVRIKPHACHDSLLFL